MRERRLRYCWSSGAMALRGHVGDPWRLRRAGRVAGRCGAARTGGGDGRQRCLSRTALHLWRSWPRPTQARHHRGLLRADPRPTRFACAPATTPPRPHGFPPTSCRRWPSTTTTSSTTRCSGCAASWNTRPSASNCCRDEFTLSELQEVYEAILNRPLDKRNFRKKLLTTGILEQTLETRKVGQHRPAALYRFNPRAEK